MSASWPPKKVEVAMETWHQAAICGALDQNDESFISSWWFQLSTNPSEKKYYCNTVRVKFKYGVKIQNL